MNQITSLSVVQITDTHLLADSQQEYKGINTYLSCEAVIKKIEKLPRQPDILLLTGDLSQDDTPESYEHLKSLISRLQIRTYWLPGNHDNLAIAQEVLASDYIFANKSFQFDRWRFLLLNSGVPGQIHGELSPETLDWLDRELQQLEERFVVIALHHPPFAIAPNWEDAILQNPEDLFAQIDPYPQVKLVLAGHVHQAARQDRRGVCYLTR